MISLYNKFYNCHRINHENQSAERMGFPIMFPVTMHREKRKVKPWIVIRSLRNRCVHICLLDVDDKKKKGTQKKNMMETSLFQKDNESSDPNTLTVDNPDLSFEHETQAIAINNFIGDNKPSAGGFGPVYKGTLANAKEIAVKRLSKGFVQDLEKFTNKVIVILKLQDPNLVR
ncbi:G-type lectin S-receptor-like serine/threonine-protein kinase At4g03230 [Papaver somniferum]|uniref:G-type lectin S-receptor-like serine/threonine-protein kinase At4g03230 n=1 Tax=Papaver somniferum TaxID=3469 RepID=UPI000E7035FD|nr:G-type lectin S-receptor-like serine/threonine-protein kinase At4g03230 [Papaver somniferum]XP_026379142.1 G-type lectin S-receptor-like serine/threonine-protein kinase At4g03230 [Papaver somniferum]XP_026379143.1 G-type lectin S-receptor-like serine/threonine-protein kinase At4g03230 [Papaver somniferum]